MKTRIQLGAGFTLVEIMIVVAIIGLLSSIAIPNLVRARTTSQKNSCLNNLREIEGATQQWALECKKSESSTVSFSDIRDYLKREFTCPASGSSGTFASSYQLNGVTNRPTCLIVPSEHVLPTAN